MPQIRNKKSGSMDNVTDEQWQAMHKVEPGQIYALASLFEVIEPQPMPEEVQKALEAQASKRKIAPEAKLHVGNKE